MTQQLPPSAHQPPARTATVTRLVPAGSTPLPVPAATVQGSLALDLRTADPAGDSPTPDPASPSVAERAGRSRLTAVGDPDVAAWAGRFAQAVVEAAGGDRPMSQLVRWTSPTVYAELEQRLRMLSRATAPARRRTVRPLVRSVHVSRPTPTAAEVSVHVRYGERSRAVAARLDHRGGRWLCTALVLG